MLVELAVDNLAIIEHAMLPLGPGLTVLTGETGAGKSLLVDALELALGERADADLVRTGASKASVHVAFQPNAEAMLRLEAEGVAMDDGSLFIHREVMAEGRSQCRIGGKLAPLSTLRQIGLGLVDLHGQHAHQSLLSVERHVEALDAWIGQPAFDLLHGAAGAHGRFAEARRKLAAMQSALRDKEHRLDLLRFQVSEIEGVDPQPGELEALEIDLTRMRHSERLAAASLSALEALSERDGSASETIGSALKPLTDATRLDPSLEVVIGPLRLASESLEDGIRALRTYAEGLEGDQARLEEAAGRVDALKRLRRKYGASEDAVLAFHEQAKLELAGLEDGEASEAALEAEAKAATAALRGACSALTSCRKERAIEFTERVQSELRDLAMEKARFEVSFADKEPSADGADRIEFFLSANVGEPPRPLAKIASGGEISRVMLAIKTALAGKAGVPTLIFDEVDAGLGGRAAAVVGKKLEELSRFYQVIVVSHLPQIASRASTHFRIEKETVGGRAVTSVRLLDSGERVEEIARMLAGETVSESALANARELLAL